MWYSFRPYVPVAQRRAQAAREVEKRRKKGQEITPVVLEGRVIAHTFWGKAWCDNLESYSDFSNRLPRGRSYVRNGSVVDLQIKPGKITALVSGSELYDVSIQITPLPANHWRTTKTRCAGQIGSLVELLQGRLSKSVMDIVTAREDGLFPKPREIEMECSCPDWAGMCKHIAAVLYGVGARLDQQPELLFLLRRVDHLELIDEAVPKLAARKTTGSRRKTLSNSDVAGVFGIELVEPEAPSSPQPIPDEPGTTRQCGGRRTAKKTSSRGKGRSSTRSAASSAARQPRQAKKTRPPWKG
jgi:uncharacterized Zn finger protein